MKPQVKTKPQVNGLLLVNKSSGPTSHDLVDQLRKILKQRSVGHAGTLDPMASGLMVMLLGKATKLSDYILNGNKTYRAKVQLGVETDTLDMVGSIIHQNGCDGVSAEAVREMAESLQGEISLQVPAFSAVKVKGKKLYEQAREGKKVEPPRRVMSFTNLQVVAQGDDWIEVEFETAKGGFVRSWAAELGSRLGCGGSLSQLIRLKSEPFDLSSALKIEALQEMFSGEKALEEASQDLFKGQSAFVPLEHALPAWKAMYLSSWDEKLLRNGQISSDFRNRMIVDQKRVNLEGEIKGVRALSAEGKGLIGLIELIPGRGAQIRRVFPLTL